VTRLCIWLLSRFLPDHLSDHVIGDIVEQRARSTLWVGRQTLAALIQLRGHSRGDDTMATFINDIRLAIRQLRRAPAFAIASIVTLGLAIGATASIFSVIDPVLLRPLPYAGANRLVFVWERDRDGSRSNVGFETIKDFAAHSGSIELSAAIGSWEPSIGDADPERVTGSRVSATYFKTLGVQPALGRDFLAEEDQPGHNQVVILSHRLWQRRFGGDQSIIGRSISIGGSPMSVVGVMPESFDNVVAPNAEIWRVLGYSTTQPFACRTCRHLRMLARLEPAATIASATTELDHVHEGLVKQFPTQYGSVGTSVVRLQDEVTRSFRPALLALAGAVALVLLIAVSNVVNLQLARAVRREEEFAIRTALGASRWRLTRQLLAEGLVLALCGGVAGALVACLALPLLVVHLPPMLPRLSAIHLGGAPLAVIGVTVMLLATVMALVPGRARDAQLGASLRSGKRLAGSAPHMTRSTLVVVEVAVAVMLLISAGLLARSLVRLLGVDAGFDASHLLTLEVDAVGKHYADDASIYAFHDRVRDAVRALPGVVGVATTNQMPLGGNMDSYGVVDSDNPPANPELAPSGDRYVVSTDYLSTMRIPVLRGRAFTNADLVDSTHRVVLLSAALAARLWPGTDPLGRHIQLGGPTAPIRTVVGVVGNVKHSGLDATTTMQWYAPERQWNFSDSEIRLLVRTTNDPASVTASVRRAIASVDPSQPVIRVATMEQVVAQSTAQRRLALVLFAAFASAALLLSIAGIYGVLAGNVAERTKEIGLRSALGATPREIVALVVRRGSLLAVMGIVIGLAGALALTRFLRTLLYGIATSDPATLVASVAVLAAVTLAACAIPALRAVRIDPSQALRSD
jgi:putative ABC transport system permease protein